MFDPFEEEKMHRGWRHKKFRFRKKVAGFDYDHTIVKPKSNSSFSKNVDDWMFIRDNVKDKIQEFYKKGYAILVFTTQSKDYKIEQIRIVLDSLEVPYQVYISNHKLVRKPDPFYFNLYSALKEVDMKKSFYVGDAMGRQHDWSDVDKKFALNCGLTPKTPEEIFPFENNIIHSTPNPVYDEQSTNPYFEKVKPYGKEKQELVILVGFPGSGKTTMSTLFESSEHYEILHGDDLKTESKMKKAVKSGIEHGKSVLIDATNPSIKKRNVFIELVRKINKDIHIRVIELSTSMEESVYRNSMREKPVPKIVFYVFRKNYEKPSLDEGIDDYILI